MHGRGRYDVFGRTQQFSLAQIFRQGLIIIYFGSSKKAPQAGPKGSNDTNNDTLPSG